MLYKWIRRSEHSVQVDIFRRVPTISRTKFECCTLPYSEFHSYKGWNIIYRMKWAASYFLLSLTPLSRLVGVRRNYLHYGTWWMCNTNHKFHLHLLFRFFWMQFDFYFHRKLNFNCCMDYWRNLLFLFCFQLTHKCTLQMRWMNEHILTSWCNDCFQANRLCTLLSIFNRLHISANVFSNASMVVAKHSILLI